MHYSRNGFHTFSWNYYTDSVKDFFNSFLQNYLQILLTVFVNILSRIPPLIYSRGFQQAFQLVLMTSSGKNTLFPFTQMSNLERSSTVGIWTYVSMVLPAAPSVCFRDFFPRFIWKFFKLTFLFLLGFLLTFLKYFLKNFEKLKAHTKNP